jgi:hypothetical protein
MDAPFTELRMYLIIVSLNLPVLAFCNKTLKKGLLIRGKKSL